MTFHKFRSIAFHAAIKNGVPIQPVAIYCQPLFLGKKQRWLAFSKHKNSVTLHYLPLIYVDDLATEKQSAACLAAATKKAIQNELNNLSAAQN